MAINVTSECITLTSLYSEMNEIKSLNLKLDLSRGKPSREQLQLSMGMLDCLSSADDIYTAEGFDCRNYGILDGIPEAKTLMADMLGVKKENVIVGGNSSLTLMYDIVSHAMTAGLLGDTPWCKLERVKFLCPSPGYDRHFAITEHFGIELIPVKMNEDGPDMDEVEALVSGDSSVKGIWCVPKYQNPTGYSFSDDVVRRFARLSPAARDFRIFWDNAYCIHGLRDEDDSILNIHDECVAAGRADMVYEFCSTSKISFPGAGISAVAASEANIADIKSFMKYSTIGPDKLNQLRHVRFFGDIDGIKRHMMSHADIMRPKFEKVIGILKKELGDTGFASWTEPRGGYFISLDTLPGCATRVVELASDMGVVFTPAGATYPYGCDPEDRNIRLAPSFAEIDEISVATKVLTLAIKIASLEKLDK